MVVWLQYNICYTLRDGKMNGCLEKYMCNELPLETGYIPWLIRALNLNGRQTMQTQPPIRKKKNLVLLCAMLHRR